MFSKHTRWIMAWIVLIAAPAYAQLEVETTRIAGVKVWYAGSDAVPVVDVMLNFEGAGNTSDPESKAGRAAFAAAMISEGAGTLDSVAFARALEENAITLEVRASDDRLGVHVHCLREHAARAGELLAMLLTQPQLTETDTARVKSQMLSQLAQLEEDPGYQAGQLLSARAFKGHPYANPPYGTPASIPALTPQDVRDYLGTYVTRGNVRIAAAGDVDSGLLDALLSPALEGLAENDAGAVAMTQTALQGGGETVRQPMAVPQSVVTFAAPMVARDDPKFYAAYLLNQILGGNPLTSRLGTELRQKKGLVYGISTDFDMRRGVSLLAGTFATRNGSVDTAVAEVRNVLTAIHDKGVTTEECADAKSYVIGAFPLQLDSSRNVTEKLMSMQLYGLGENYLEEREKLFARVSCADVNAIAEELLSPSRFLFAVVGGAGSVP